MALALLVGISGRKKVSIFKGPCIGFALIKIIKARSIQTTGTLTVNPDQYSSMNLVGVKYSGETLDFRFYFVFLDDSTVGTVFRRQESVV
jgi:hypothetical protein